MTDNPKHMPHDVVIDRQAGEIRIDGEVLPYLVTEDGPTIHRLGVRDWGPETVVEIPIMVFASDLRIIAREGSQCIVREVPAPPKDAA